jgi:GT2 family glycosyltransferase
VTLLAPSGVVPSAPAPGVDAPLGIVVVSYGSADLLRRNLAPAQLGGAQVRVVVVDNYSTDDNRRSVEELGAAHGWYVVGMPDNRGFGAACNAGIAAARAQGCRSFLFLNPDAVITPATVAELRAHSLREPMALISPQLVSSTGEVVFRVARTDLRDGRVRRRPDGEGAQTSDAGDWLCGACVVVHDELLSRIGGFDEGYFLYWEDVDLGYRAVAAGGSVILREDLSAIHDEGGTHGPREGRAKSGLYYRYNCRNRLLFAARYLDRRGLLRWLLTTPAVSWEILLRGGRRQLVHSPWLFFSAVLGALTGVAAVLPALVTGPRWRPERPSVLVAHAGAELYGSDRVLLASVEALLTRGPVTVALPGPGPLVAELEARGADVVTCPMPVLRKSVFSPAGAARLVADVVRGFLPALRLLGGAGRGGVYVNTTVLPWWLLLGRLARRRVVCHVHEAEWPGPEALHRLMLRPLLAADAVIANSRFTAEVLTRLVPALAPRTTVVPNPVSAPTAVRPARERLEGPLRLLFVGRLSPRKGPDVAVAALRELVARGVDARLTLAGSTFTGYEWFEAELRATIAAAGLEDRVELAGFHADVWPLLAHADVVLVPSVLDESFGNAAVEAVLAARPVVVSELPGLREATAGYAGALVAEPGSAVAWADAVEAIAADWPAFRVAAARDAATARQRHGAGPFAELLLRAVPFSGVHTPVASPGRR